MKLKSLLIATLLASTVQSALAEQILRRGNGAEPQTLDPQMASGVPEADILQDLFEGLVAYSGDGKLVAGVAESWQVSDDGKVYTFKLRESQWSDGTPLTAHDFVYALQRVVNPELASLNATHVYPILNAKAIATGEQKDLSALGVKAIDDLTLEITLEHPAPYFLYILAHNSTLPVPKHVVEKFGKEWTRKEHIVSNGAFNLTDHQPNLQITTTKSKTYWNQDSVKLDKVIFFTSEDLNSELKRYRADEIDLTQQIPHDQINWIKENIPNELKTASSADLYYYGFNASIPPFKDNPKLRKALSLAIDRDVIVNKIINSGERATHSVLPDNMTGGYMAYTPEEANMTQAERVEKAKALYQEAGYSAENPLKFTLLYNTSDNHKKVAIAIGAMWKQNLGAEVSLENKEWKVYLQERQQKSPSMHVFRAGWALGYLDPNSILERFQSTMDTNDISFNNAQYDENMQASVTETDVAKRFEFLRQAEKILIDEQGLIPIYHYMNRSLVKPYVKGYDLNITNRNRSQYLSIEK
ncbi:MAG: peptide ABC transporter substrate-binding protein [Cardiobacteriaceae bacterium]|nr:peptide ABC transporter substrate-binding protein [Cardiobacteriaceae bacterium]